MCHIYLYNLRKSFLVILHTNISVVSLLLACLHFLVGGTEESCSSHMHTCTSVLLTQQLNLTYRMMTVKRTRVQPFMTAGNVDTVCCKYTRSLSNVLNGREGQQRSKLCNMVHLSCFQSRLRSWSQLGLRDKTAYAAFTSFCETTLNQRTPDKVMTAASYTIYQGDRSPAASGKTCWGRTGILIKQSWCSNNTVISELCSVDVDFMTEVQTMLLTSTTAVHHSEHSVLTPLSY